jgi:hypothetical protein
MAEQDESDAGFDAAPTSYNRQLRSRLPPSSSSNNADDFGFLPNNDVPPNSQGPGSKRPDPASEAEDNLKHTKSVDADDQMIIDCSGVGASAKGGEAEGMLDVYFWLFKVTDHQCTLCH